MILSKIPVFFTPGICANYRNALPREPLKSHDPPMYPSEKIGADLYSFDSTDYIIAIRLLFRLP